jgi:hypothetical protein
MIRRAVFAVAAWLFLIGVVVQVFLAGAGLFGLSDFTPHAGFGWLLASLPILLVLLVLLAGLGRRTVLLTVALAVVTAIQPELAAARYENPVVASLHPVNALLVFWLAWVVARRATRLARQPERPQAMTAKASGAEASSTDAAA